MSFYFILHLLCTIAIALPGVLGYNLMFGKGKIFHFGPLGTSIVAAYGLYLTWMMSGSLLLGIVVSLALTLLLALLFLWLSVRLDPDGLGILTIAVHLALLAVVLNWTELTGGSLGITNVPRLPFMESMGGFVIVSVMIAAAWVGFMLWLEKRPFGRSLSALSEHGWHAQAVGVNRTRTYLLTFCIGSVGLLLTECLMPAYLRFLHPNSYTFGAFIFLLMCVVAGRPGSMKGVTLSTILLILLRESLRFLPLPTSAVGPLRLLLFGGILLLAVYIRRDTLFPSQRSV